MSGTDVAGAVAENRRSWDRMAELHARGSGAAFYRLEEFIAGECKLAPWEIEEVGPVEGLELLHLQCHIGLDTLSWARRGAQVTGLDFSPQAIEEAREIARRIGVEARFVTGEVQRASELLEGRRFDIAYTGRGALCWLPDLKSWARQCAALCRPGGMLFLEESHPTLDLMKVENGAAGEVRPVPGYDAFHRGVVSETSEGSYADRGAPTGPMTTHCWEHGLGEVVSSLVAAGFDLVHLHEREEVFFEPWEGVFEPAGPNLWKFREGQVRFPASYTLKMRRRSDEGSEPSGA